jgi:hypothetical protein
VNEEALAHWGLLRQKKMVIQKVSLIKVDLPVATDNLRPKLLLVSLK